MTSLKILRIFILQHLKDGSSRASKICAFLSEMLNIAKLKILLELSNVRRMYIDQLANVRQRDLFKRFYVFCRFIPLEIFPPGATLCVEAGRKKEKKRSSLGNEIDVETRRVKIEDCPGDCLN